MLLRCRLQGPWRKRLACSCAEVNDGELPPMRRSVLLLRSRLADGHCVRALLMALLSLRSRLRSLRAGVAWTEHRVNRAVVSVARRGRSTKRRRVLEEAGIRRKEDSNCELFVRRRGVEEGGFEF